MLRILERATLKNADNYVLCNVMLECSGNESDDQVTIDAETNEITGYTCIGVDREFQETFFILGTSFLISEDENEFLDVGTSIHARQLDTILRVKGWIVLK